MALQLEFLHEEEFELVDGEGAISAEVHEDEKVHHFVDVVIFNQDLVHVCECFCLKSFKIQRAILHDCLADLKQWYFLD